MPTIAAHRITCPAGEAGSPERTRAVACRRVNTISSGATDTDLLRATNPPEALAQTAALTALKRIGQPDDIAAGAVFLAGPDAQWITGQNIRVTGGLLV
jgi:3-oxoacyl-[acyl-carrier protein] reductase